MDVARAAQAPRVTPYFFKPKESFKYSIFNRYERMKISQIIFFAQKAKK
jgi:hypothetical protein